MDYDRDKDGYIYDRVKWHTRKKHFFIESYLQIWVDKVKRNQPTLDIFDLFAATGLCYCEDIAEPNSRWEGSACLAARCLEGYPRGRYLFLNTYHPDEEMFAAQKANLTRKISEIRKSKPGYTEIVSKEIDQAVEDAIAFAESKNLLQYPTIWVLDPCAASTLPWSVVERIGKLRRTYYSPKSGERVRKPELIINLMTSDLQRNIKTNPHVISIALGLDEGVWRPEIDDLMQTKGYNTREALIELYARRLSELYDKAPIISEINTTNESAIVYCLFLCTDNNAGHYMGKLQGLKDYNTRLYDWRHEARRVVAEKKLPPDQTKLF
ncbi:three-Cys-motif partner protein TcmP [Methanoculleus sediminis]|uniref:three-Cys-motif partner protein TcmP n=1 Tax=Methanoculleus sediminis TaxID=1550566 RepID=UPI0009E652E5|nr:three-Cys-motif partner protein TcmP [Methanoculleus sediminis]